MTGGAERVAQGPKRGGGGSYIPNVGGQRGPPGVILRGRDTHIDFLSLLKCKAVHCG